MVIKPGTAAKRMRALLEQLVEENGGATRGAKQQTVRMTGLDQAQVSRALRGEVGFGIEKFEIVAAKLKLRWDYFTSPVEPRSYRDYVGTRYPALSEFLLEPEGRTCKPDEFAFLASCVFAAGPPNVSTYRALLFAYRGAYVHGSGLAPEDDFEDADLDEAIDAELSGKPDTAKNRRKAKPAKSTRRGDAGREHRS